MVVEEQVNEVTGAVETIVKQVADPEGGQVTLYGFRGGGTIGDLANSSVHPYEYTGHAGYWFDGGKTIHGFGLDVGDMTAPKRSCP